MSSWFILIVDLACTAQNNIRSLSIAGDHFTVAKMYSVVCGPKAATEQLKRPFNQFASERERERTRTKKW